LLPGRFQRCLARARYASLLRNAARAITVFTVYNLRRASLLAGP
jgi:IS5 family transposase